MSKMKRCELFWRFVSTELNLPQQDNPLYTSIILAEAAQACDEFSILMK
jgi:hypothetical protein